MTAPPIAEEPAAGLVPPPRGRRRVTVWRLLVALVELLAAAAAIWLAFQCWPRGIATITLVLEDGTELVSTRYFGNWMAAAIGLGTLAGLLVTDAVRQVLVALRRPANSQVVPS
ncbi:MAG TPA: hypothetical protein VFV67_04185 [Actinophytocola sp.]|uniref:hypothetical protein n=1 Tax=Actinophytocola sp. TaxID=1872138 RepID=UPI002DB5C7F9|nr:hypothetical protein [Actinophytocola sp.]HEU5469827.1 hypothetical protein [Actinophytocola sp.]